jgi:hypothetical protein
MTNNNEQRFYLVKVAADGSVAYWSGFDDSDFYLTWEQTCNDIVSSKKSHLEFWVEKINNRFKNHTMNLQIIAA